MIQTRILSTTAVLSATLFAAVPAAEKEKTVDSRIASAALFKNGLAVIRRTVAIPAPGTYRVTDVPVPVHGTFWIDSDAVVETRVTSRNVSSTLTRSNPVDFQADLAGKKVTVTFRDGRIPQVTGRVVAVAPATGEDAWNRTYQRPRNHWGYNPSANRPAPSGRFLVMDTDTGRMFVESGMIACLHTAGPVETFTRQMPVLILNVTEMKKKPATVSITCLTKGMAWAPSYRIDISDPKQLELRQKAVIKNELGDLADTDITLISGFPSVQFSHVTSPLSPRTNWSQFFTQLSRRARAGSGVGHQAVTQQRIMSNVAAPSAPDLSAIPTGEGVDLHYQPIGKRTLKEGDALALSVASGTADYERIVEWLIPDTRTADGRVIPDHRRRQDPEKYKDAAWDAVRFRNPLAFPMTTAPAMVVSGGRFNGQRMSYWTNAGETATVHVTKALSIRTRHVEQEEQGKRKIVYIGGDDYRTVGVTGELTVNNHRKETVRLVIRRRFSGELVEADGDPTCTLREEGVYSVNRRNELFWEFPLKPGEEKTLAYRYTVLVNN